MSIDIAKGIIFLYLILWIYHKQYKKLTKLKDNWFVLSSIAYFLVFVLSGLYSEDLTFWLQDIEHKVPFLILPIILSTKPISKEVFRIIMWSFTIGCFLLMLYGYFNQPSDFISLRKIVNKYTPINIIYYSLYISIIFFYLFYELLILKVKKYRAFYIISIFLAFYILYGCASRMVILTTFIVSIAVVVIWKIIYERKLLEGIGLVLLIILVNGTSLYLNKSTSTRFEKLIVHKGDNRNRIWEASWLTIKKSPIIGFGAGDTKSALAPSYIKVDYPLGVKKNVNCHNQYLESWLSTGIFGLLILLIWLFASFYDAWKKHNYLFCIFILIIAMNILVESVFERQHGTFFMAFLGSLLFGYGQKEKSNLN
ncbi:MAG: O-antigen ligase family protein [Polaribacter sp.]